MALGDDESTARAIDFPIVGSFEAYDFLNLLSEYRSRQRLAVWTIV